MEPFRLRGAFSVREVSAKLLRRASLPGEEILLETP
jgi:hypothetical protein